MSRYIDADNLVSVLDILCDKGGDIRYWEQLKWIVADCPTADVVEVVRCKDCKHRIIESNDDWCECTGCDINPDGFCEEGERKEDANKID